MNNSLAAYCTCVPCTYYTTLLIREKGSIIAHATAVIKYIYPAESQFLICMLHDYYKINDNSLRQIATSAKMHNTCTETSSYYRNYYDVQCMSVRI